MNDTFNPKDAAGRAKLPLHLWPTTASAAGCLGFREGELKYGRNNFRGADVAASVYVAAAKRHIDAWFEGEDNTADYGTPHLGNALACLAILVDAQVNGSLIDDRNFTREPGAYEDFVAEMTRISAQLTSKLGHMRPKHWDRRDQVEDEQAVVHEFAFKSAEKQDVGGAEPGPASAPEKNLDEECQCLACTLNKVIAGVFDQVNEVPKGTAKVISLADFIADAKRRYG